MFAGLIYMALTFALVALFKLAERRWLAHLRAQRVESIAS